MRGGWPDQKRGRIASTHHQACRHPEMSWTPGIVYWASIWERETLRSPDLTIRWIRKAGGVGRRGGSQYRLTRASYSPQEVNKSYTRAIK